MIYLIDIYLVPFIEGLNNEVKEGDIKLLTK